MDANRPLSAQEIAFAFTLSPSNVSPMDLYRLFTEIEFDQCYLDAILIALDQGYGDDDIAALQTMVDEIGRFQKSSKGKFEVGVGESIEEIFSHLDRLGVDHRRIVYDDLDAVVSIAGDF